MFGKVFYKSDKPVFRTDELDALVLENAAKSGFLNLIDTITVKEDIIVTEFHEDMPGLDALIENKITTFEQLNAIDDLTTLKGIGAATSKSILEFLED